MIALHPILTGVSISLFVSAFGVSAGVIVASLAPQWDRIYRLALGHVEPAPEPPHARLFAKAIRL